MTIRRLYSHTLALVALFAVSSLAHAFGGCVDSPENPTLILGLIGGAAAAAPWCLKKLKARNKNRDQ